MKIPVLLSGLLAAFVGIFFISRPAYAAPDRPQTRIIGGQPAANGQFPFMAALILNSNSFNRVAAFFCGGTLIHPRWVLTAAHCVTTASGDSFIVDSPSIESVLLNVTHLANDPGELRAINRIIVHPAYHPQTHANDIALLELSQESTAPPIWLTSFDVDQPVVATAPGWGVTQNGGSVSPALNFVNMPLVSSAMCNEALPGEQVTSTMICAGLPNGSVDTCTGDSGGPLLVFQNGQWRVAGITSWGLGCAVAGLFGVYTRISEFGSFITRYVPSPIAQPELSAAGPHALWNGFLNMVDIIELVNDTTQPQAISVYLSDANGRVVSVNEFTIDPAKQQDVIVNSLTGFEPDTYGTLRILGEIGGRVSYYRPATPAFQSFDFAFALPLSEPMFGSSYVSYNTFQPSFFPADQANIVANWLSIVNLASSTKSFVVKKRDQQGTLLSSQQIALFANERFDLEGGHQNPGPAQVGLLEILPDDGNSPYLSQLVRYGSKPNGAFDFAFPLLPEAGANVSRILPLSTTVNAQNWLEVINASSQPQDVLVSFFTQDGFAAGTETLNQLPPKSQIHLNVNQVIGNESLGHVRISSGPSAAILAQSMVYSRGGLGNVEAMYGTQAESPASAPITGSFNLFLGMQNWLKIINPEESPLDVKLTVSSLFSSGSTQTLQLPPFSSRDLFLNAPAFGAAADTYGTVTVEPLGGGSIVSQVLRVKYGASDELQFLMPTKVD